MRRHAARWIQGTILCTAFAAAAPGGPHGAAPGGAAARQVFDRFQSLSGEWRGRSSKGWDDRVTFQVIASGSAVVETSLFEAHPGETMLTVYHLDGDRMMLTHYCVAKNQPRLQVSSIEDGGNRVTFSFRDATNLASLDQGHMDRVVFEFLDRDHFSSRWSFYKNGREEWRVEVHYERVRGPGRGRRVSEPLGRGVLSGSVPRPHLRDLQARPADPQRKGGGRRRGGPVGLDPGRAAAAGVPLGI